MTEKPKYAPIDRPLQYAVYKAQGAFQLNFRSPVKKDDKDQEGVIFVDAANSKGKMAYDWSQGKKVVFALKLVDVGKIVSGLNTTGEVSLVHDKFAKTDKARQRFTSLKITKGKDGKSYLWKFGVKDTSNPSEDRSVSIYTDLAETRIISSLLESAIPKLLGW